MKYFVIIFLLVIFSSCKKEDKNTFFIKSKNDVSDIMKENEVFVYRDSSLMNNESFKLRENEIFVDIDTSILKLNTELKMSVFNKKIALKLDSVWDESINIKSWIGSVDSEPNSFFLTRYDDEYLGVFNDKNDTYELFIDNSLNYKIKKIIYTPKKCSGSIINNNLDEEFVRNLRQSESKKDNTYVKNSYGLDVIDVLVLYTRGALPQGPNKAKKMISTIQLANIRANQALRSSNTSAILNISKIKEISYNEQKDVEKDLEWLQKNEYIKRLRNNYGADLVVLYVGDGGKSAGIANLPSSINLNNREQAFAVVQRDYAVGQLTYAHEVGHLLGLRHNCEEDSNPFPFKFSHGYSYCKNDVKFRTIMSYQNCSEQRIGYFSTPFVKYRNVPVGKREGNCHSNSAYSITRAASTVSKYRRGIKHQPPIKLCGNNICKTVFNVYARNHKWQKSFFEIGVGEKFKIEVNKNYKWKSNVKSCNYLGSNIRAPQQYAFPGHNEMALAINLKFNNRNNFLVGEEILNINGKVFTNSSKHRVSVWFIANDGITTRKNGYLDNNGYIPVTITIWQN